LRYAAKKAGSTRADGLEAMTISMLRGSDGFQAEELQQLIDFLKHHEKPDVVHLSNALLLGLAEKIHTDLQIPVVCSLQDEDVWVDAMEPQFRDQVWQLMAEKGKFVDSFVAVSDFYAGIMKKNMNIPDHKMNIVHIGVNPENYTVHTPSIHPPVIGYLSRLCDENGLEVLVDAFIELKDTSTFKTAKLRITGGKTADDKPFINKQLKKLKKKEYLNDVEFIDDFRTEALSDFFRGLTVLSVPVLKGEAFGLYQLESLASGIPVVQPALGAFPEIAEVTGGGVIYHPNSPQALSAALESLFSTPEKITLMSEKGRQAVKDLFNSEALAGKMVQVYENAKAKKFQHAT
jgi:glycosyltransferase involved in cell wall biosynthesis